MSKSIIRAYTAWWPNTDISTRKEAEKQDMTELWTAEYMRSEGFSKEDIDIVEHLQPGDSQRFHCDGFNVVVCYDGEEYEDTSYTFSQEAHHLNWYDVSGRGDYGYSC